MDGPHNSSRAPLFRLHGLFPGSVYHAYIYIYIYIIHIRYILYICTHYTFLTRFHDEYYEYTKTHIHHIDVIDIVQISCKSIFFGVFLNTHFPEVFRKRQAARVRSRTTRRVAEVSGLLGPGHSVLFGWLVQSAEKSLHVKTCEFLGLLERA